MSRRRRHALRKCLNELHDLVAARVMPMSEAMRQMESKGVPYSVQWRVCTR